MTLSASNEKRYGWAGNCGGGDFLLWIDEGGQYQGFRETKTDYRSYGPCLTDVSYLEETLNGEIDSRVNTSISRSDDYLRAFHRLRYDVRKPVKWQRLAFYQLGADYYNATPARRVAIGDANGLMDEWEPTLGKDVYDRTSVPLPGEAPWISIHGVERAGMAQGEAFATQRPYCSALGKPCSVASLVLDHMAPFMQPKGKGNFRTTVEISPPPDIFSLKGRRLRGCFGRISSLSFRLNSKAYYGPNKIFSKRFGKRCG
jgi:hypothetical protein